MSKKVIVTLQNKECKEKRERYKVSIIILIQKGLNGDGCFGLNQLEKINKTINKSTNQPHTQKKKT